MPGQDLAAIEVGSSPTASTIERVKMTSDDDHMNQHPNAAAARQRTGEDLAAGRALDLAARISRFKEMAARRGLTVDEQHDVLLGLGDAAATQLQFERDQAARRAEDARIWGRPHG